MSPEDPAEDQMSTHLTEARNFMNEESGMIDARLVSYYGPGTPYPVPLPIYIVAVTFITNRIAMYTIKFELCQNLPKIFT